MVGTVAAAVASSLVAANAASTAGQDIFMTISGLSFGDLDPTISARLGSSASVTSTWTSTSSVQVLTDVAPREAGVQFLQLRVTVAAVAGTAFPYMSFDGTHIVECHSLQVPRSMRCPM